MVRFTFERLSDHLIAQRLLETHIGDSDPIPAFANSGTLAPYVTGNDAYRFAGVAEALAVQVPERYGVELIDIVQDKSARWDLLHGFRLSLLWRRQDVFTERTLALLEEMADAIGGDPVLETLLAIATEPDNRFNADHLDARLQAMAMPERDQEWSTRAAIVAEHGEGVIDTLIEWVIANGLDVIEPARARLAAMALAWLTSLSHRAVRDMATKALATLLVNRRDVAAELIRRFAAIDDPYVIDRVLAAAYGAATRSYSDGGLADLARAAFEAVFERKPFPVHALIRDHARGIIELAASRGVLPRDLSLDRARAPYARGEPLEIVSDPMLTGYIQDYGGSYFRDEICSSAVEDGDFARYEIDPLASQFLLLPREEVGRPMRDIYEAWHGSTIAPFPERHEAFARVLHLAEDALSKSMVDLWPGGSDERYVARRAAEEDRDAAISDFETLLNGEEVREFRIRAAGYLRGRMWDEGMPAWHPTYSGKGARHWVAWRAHELGWTPERFGDFDCEMRTHGRMEHRIERIGKKYQWIAYHELTGRLSDIAAVEGDDQPQHYCGPWQVGTREMDPTLLVTHTEQHGSRRQGPTWWSPHASRWREDPPAARIAWMEDPVRDMPDPVQQIDVTDPDGRRWLALDTNAARNHWAMVDGQRVIHRMTWHKVKSLLVASADVQRLTQLLTRSDRYRDHPPEVEMPWHGYLGEYPWHPSYSDVDGSFEIGTGHNIHVQATVADWRVERSGHDYSVEESFDLTIPGPALIRGLGLRLAEGRSLAYATADGDILFKDPSADEPGFSAAVVDRKAFRAFLEAQGLEIVWIFAGEKSAHGGRPHGRGWGGMLEYWGLYRFDGDAIEGALHFHKKDARGEQLAEFLANP